MRTKERTDTELYSYWVDVFSRKSQPKPGLCWSVLVRHVAKRSWLISMAFLMILVDQRCLPWIS